MQNKKIFILCLGTQKAGTSWLFEQLFNSPEGRRPFSKELHIFDHKRYPYLFENNKKVFKELANKTSVIEKRHQIFFKRMQMISNTGLYFDYFNELLSCTTQLPTLFSGDFTPESCILPREDLILIKEQLEARNIKLKVIFLMRDPVERIWSATRMTKRQFGIDAKLIDTYNGEFVEFLTRYERIIPRISSAFGNDSLFIGSYETLFQQDTIDQLTNFLQISAIKPDFKLRINASPTEMIPDHDRAVVREYYSDTYNFISKNYPSLGIINS